MQKSRIFEAKKRTFSQTIADTAVLAAGHAYDNLSGWFDYQSPVGESDRVKLDRSASVASQDIPLLYRQEVKYGILSRIFGSLPY